MEPKEETFYFTYSKKQDFDTLHKETIYQCEDDDPPSRSTASVKKLCTFNYELDIPYDSLENFTGKTGKELRRFSFEVKMIPSGASNEFSILYQGETLGSRTVQIHFLN